MYRPPSAPPRGKWAQFLHQMRRERDWNQTQAFEALHRGLRLGPKSRASYLALDSGTRPPKAHEAAYLVSFFGREPEDVPPIDPVVAAMDRQTAAITALFGELLRWRIGEGTRLEDVEQTVRRMVAGGPLARGSGESIEHPVPPETAG